MASAGDLPFWPDHGPLFWQQGEGAGATLFWQYLAAEGAGGLVVGGAGLVEWVPAGVPRERHEVGAGGLVVGGAGARRYAQGGQHARAIIRRRPPEPEPEPVARHEVGRGGLLVGGAGLSRWVPLPVGPPVVVVYRRPLPRSAWATGTGGLVYGGAGTVRHLPAPQRAVGAGGLHYHGGGVWRTRDYVREVVQPDDEAVLLTLANVQ